MATKPFVIAPTLIAVAVSYAQANLIADKVLPRVPVDTESFRYLKHSIGDAFQSPDTRVGRKSAPNQIDWSASEATASVTDQGLDSPVPNADIEAYQRAIAAAGGNAALVSVEDPLMYTTRLIEQAVQNKREARAAALVFNTSSYAASNQVTLSGTSQWSDYTNSDPLVQLMGYLDSMIVRANVMTIGRQVATKLRMHPKVCKAVYGNNTDAGIAPLQAIADLLELEEIVVGDALINTAQPGQSPTMQRAWGKHCALTVRNKEANTKAGVTFGLTAQYGGKIAGTIDDSDIGLRGGVRVRNGESVVELITANDLGYFVGNAVA